MRTASVSIKLAEREIHYDDSGEYPILLLDDVLSELDEARQNYVLDRISSGQVFITSCDLNTETHIKSGAVLRIEEGGFK